MAMPTVNKAIWLTTLDECLMTGIHTHSYKSGSFQLSIPKKTPRTPTAEALNILIRSPLTRLDEKVTLINCKKYFLILTTSGLGDFSCAIRSLKMLLQTFQDDKAARRPGAPPPPVLQIPPLPQREQVDFEAADFEMDGFNWFTWVQNEVTKGVKEYRYKDGAFENSLKKSMSAAKVLNILLGSSMTSAHEKKVIRTARDNYQTLRQAFPSPQAPGAKDVAAIMGSFDDLWTMFRDDAKGRERYQPPVFIQNLDDVDEKKVLETYVLNPDGSATIFEGGTAFVPPDAPDEWIRENATRSANLQKETGRRKHLIFTNYGDS